MIPSVPDQKAQKALRIANLSPRSLLCLEFVCLGYLAIAFGCYNKGLFLLM
jgi:hypothetical protein